MFRYHRYSILTGTLVTLGSVAYAAGGTANDGLAVTQARVGLTQAVATAEQHANGRASRAEYELSKAGGVYDVEVVSGARVFDVKVDADKGTVIASTEDRTDRDDAHDKAD